MLARVAVDRITPEQRSRLMARVKGADTLPERLLRSFLHRRGWRFRKNVRRLQGCPDIVFAQYRTVVFVDGDFWHGFRFDEWKANLPDYWQQKIEGNRLRDRQTTARLRREGWRVVRVWEHLVMRDVEAAAKRIEKHLTRVPVSDAAP